jgi:hypothetical protein
MQLWKLKEGKGLSEWVITEVGTFPNPEQPLAVQIAELVERLPFKNSYYLVFAEEEIERLQEIGKIFYPETTAKADLLEWAVVNFATLRTGRIVSVFYVPEDPNLVLSLWDKSNTRFCLKIGGQKEKYHG